MSLSILLMIKAVIKRRGIGRMRKEGGLGRIENRVRVGDAKHIRRWQVVVGRQLPKSSAGDGGRFAREEGGADERARPTGGER